MMGALSLFGSPIIYPAIVAILLSIQPIHPHISSGCNTNPHHYGWQIPNNSSGAHWGRPKCSDKRGNVVWCDEYCHRRNKP
jgi:hypothetical protein